MSCQRRFVISFLDPAIHLVQRNKGKAICNGKILSFHAYFFPAPSENGVILYQCIPPEHFPQHGTDSVCPLPNQTKSCTLWIFLVGQSKEVSVLMKMLCFICIKKQYFLEPWKGSAEILLGSRLFNFKMLQEHQLSSPQQLHV